MTDRDLSELLQRASADLPEMDLVEEAWAGALAERARRRQRWFTGVGALAAATVAVTVVQLAGPSDDRTPTPTYTTRTPASTGTLADRTAYAQLPLEGKEGELPWLDLGLPEVIDPARARTPLSSLAEPPTSVVGVYLRIEGNRYRPVVVAPDGTQYVVDTVLLEPTVDADGNQGIPLGPRAFGARDAVFPQPMKLVRVDLFTGLVRTYPLPSRHVLTAGWTASGAQIVVRGDGQAWTLDPWVPEAKAKASGPAAYDGAYRISADDDLNAGRHVVVTRQDDETHQPGTGGELGAPVMGTWGETVGVQDWAAVGAFFDQVVTSEVIRKGNGPIYQGVVAVDVKAWKARLLLAPENPDGQTGRFKGCCSVLGWADAKTVLLQTVGSHGSWILAWDVTSGTVHRVTRIEVDPSQEEIPRFALNVGWRY